ncbi:MAG: cell division protein FtsL [Sedimenticola sp.]|nr:cell division protein FtsL [Sedimenticola sp.]MCW8920424.1 cell division protein FtsL [Sedimenticola sp.]MCW8947349.1 cell division protein FtsL [Sedimenticola sp.]MCW8976532.1 cell division protein FtsL [Sedimenticola sp.]MDF1528719.1 cell division protein FtsL [Sedimenticola sp.]
MTRGQLMVLLILTFGLLVTATGVVYSKYASRKNFVALQLLHAERDSLEVEWGRLQLEQSTWATHARVEKIARKRLKMHIPTAEEVVVVKP